MENAADASAEPWNFVQFRNGTFADHGFCSLVCWTEVSSTGASRSGVCRRLITLTSRDKKQGRVLGRINSACIYLVFSI